jgi:hypothetical protein
MKLLKRGIALLIVCGLALTAGPSVVQALAKVAGASEPRFQVETNIQ